MKILYVVNSGGPDGSSLSLFNLISEIYHDIEVVVVSPNRGAFTSKIEAIGVKCYYLPLLQMTRYPHYVTLIGKIMFLYRLILNILKNNVSYFQLLRIAKKVKPDIIHTNVGPLSTGFKVANVLNIKHVWHLREYQDLDFGIHFFPSIRSFHRMLRHPNNFSIAITKGIFEHWKLNPQKDEVIYDGVIGDEEHICIEEKKKFFLFVGRIEEAKGLKVLLETFIEFCKTNSQYQLLIAGKGEGAYLKECISLVKDNNLQDYISFLGHRSDVYKLMEEATALLVSSRFEGFGFITAEAMYNHCLVIGRDTAGTNEQFDIGLEQMGSNIGFRYFKDEDLLPVMQNVVNLSLEDRSHIIQNAYKTVKYNFTIHRYGNEVKNFYKKVLNV